jgi:hypothetical protein
MIKIMIRKSPTQLLYKDIPDGICDKAHYKQRSEGIFTYINKPLIDGLCELFAGKNVLEVYAGRGHMSALLHERGINVKSTSLRQGHDGSEALGHVFDVEDMDAVSAVKNYKEWMGALLVCWPTTDSGMFNVLRNLPKGMPIVFIGEVTDYTLNPPFLGGCASDDFFHNVRENKALTQSINYKTYGASQFKVFYRNSRIEKIKDDKFDIYSEFNL